MPIDPNAFPGPKGQEAVRFLNSLESQIADLRAAVTALQVEHRTGRFITPDVPTGERTWHGFDPSILPGHAEPYETVAWVPVRTDGKDTRREIVRVWGGPQDSRPAHSQGFRLEHRQRLTEGVDWTQGNAIELLIRGTQILSHDNASEALPWTVDPWTVDLTPRLEFSEPIVLAEFIIGSFGEDYPYIDATDFEDGDTIGWYRVVSELGYSRIETVVAWQGEPWLSFRGRPPYAANAAFRITEDGELRTISGQPLANPPLFQEALGPTEVFP